MAKGSTFIKIEGFEDLIKQITEAGGKIDEAVTSCVEKSANVMDEELKAKMTKTKVSSDLIHRMPKPEIYKTPYSVGARVGYKTGDYNPKELTVGYKAMFINYGTPRIKPRDFIKKAKSSGKRKVKQLQEETLNEILKGLKK